MTKNKSVFTKPISIILSLMIVITSLSSAAVFTTSAAQTEGVISFDESFYLKNKDACDKVADGIKNLEQHIDISDCKLSTGDVSELMYVCYIPQSGTILCYRSLFLLHKRKLCNSNCS